MDPYILHFLSYSYSFPLIAMRNRKKLNAGGWPDVRMFGPPWFRPVTPGGGALLIPAGNEGLLLLV